MRLRTKCRMEFEIGSPTPFLLMLRPRSGANQWIVREEYLIEPTIPVLEFVDSFGNLCQRLTVQIGHCTISTGADVEAADRVDRNADAPFVAIENLPDTVLCFLLPSRYCEVEKFRDLAVTITGNRRAGYEQVLAIEEWIRNRIAFIPGSSDYPLSAVEVNQKRCGVCRDHAHLAIALCRSLCIPARMVVGYLHKLNPMDLHAWFEAYIGGRWYTFDSTQKEVIGGYVIIAYGRDAADVAIFTQFGPFVPPCSQIVEVDELLRGSD